MIWESRATLRRRHSSRSDSWCAAAAHPVPRSPRRRRPPIPEAPAPAAPVMSARAEAATPRALARLYCPPAQAPVLAALLGIEAEIRAALKPGLEHEVAHA